MSCYYNVDGYNVNRGNPMNADKLPQLSLSEANQMALDILYRAEERRRQTAEAEAAHGIDWEDVLLPPLVREIAEIIEPNVFQRWYVQYANEEPDEYCSTRMKLEQSKAIHKASKIMKMLVDESKTVVHQSLRELDESLWLEMGIPKEHAEKIVELSHAEP
jgi:hypothetical protein